MNTPYLRKGDCIHLAVPTGPEDPMMVGAAMARAYEQIGVRVFMIDHVRGLAAPTVVSVVRGVPPEIRFS